MSALRQRLAGLLAVLALLGLTLGLPAVLLATGATPIPSSWPTLASLRTLLTSPDDGTLVLTVVKVLAWAVWLFLTMSILAELSSRARCVQAPHLPGLRLPQHAARGLVGAAALLFTAAVPIVAQAAPLNAPPAPPPAVSTLSTTDAARRAPVPTETTPPQVAPATVTHTVSHGESLWSIAEDHLGDGSRYREIVDLNPATLHGKAEFIRPGWVLTVPAATIASTENATTYTVRSGDTLSAVAEHQLGDAARWPEIGAASHLRDPDLITPGQTLTIPAAAHLGVTAPAGTPTQPTLTAPAPTPHLTTPPAAVSPPLPLLPPAEPQPAQPTNPLRSAGTLTAPITSTTPTSSISDTADHLDGHTTDWPLRTGYGAGAVLAAGVITLLTTRRRAQQRHRQPGQRLPAPTPATATAEHELRVTADALSVDAVDTALRALARSCATSGDPLPVVRAARLTADQFDLYLAEPATLPAPWTGTSDATVWTLDRDHTTPVNLDVTGVPSPYPALVTIGHDTENGHVLLDLEHLGALGVIGDPTSTRDVLAALAVELATSTWADDLQVTIVGAFPDLEDALQTGRIRYLPSVGRILDDLTARAGHDRAALTAEDTATLRHARVTGSAPDAWTPEIVLLAGPITERQRTQLDRLLDELPRVALAAVTSGVCVGEWALDLTTTTDPDGLAVLSPIGLSLHPQRLPAEQYGHLLDLVASTSTDEPLPAAETDVAPEPKLDDVAAITAIDDAHLDPHTTDAGALTAAVITGTLLPGDVGITTDADDPTIPAPSDDARDQPRKDAEHMVDAITSPAGPAQLIDLTTDAANDVAHHHLDEAAEPANPPAPRLLLLGPVELINATGPVEPTKRPRFLEFAAYLALHPGSSHTSIDDAIWPNRKSEDNLNTRNTATSKLRRWVGTTPDGREYLPRLGSDGYRFLPEVHTDVDDWDALLTGGPLHAPTENLEKALTLVRGRPFEGHHRRYYAWAEAISQRLISEIVDASYELARRRIMEGRWRAAEDAVVVGLRIEPAQERLWRMRILAAHESRHINAQAEAIERLLTIAEELECDLEPETEALLEGLKNPRTELDQLLANAL